MARRNLGESSPTLPPAGLFEASRSLGVRCGCSRFRLNRPRESTGSNDLGRWSSAITPCVARNAKIKSTRRLDNSEVIFSIGSLQQWPVPRLIGGRLLRMPQAVTPEAATLQLAR